ncbi:MAG: signal peptidase I [Clostridiales bacterium]|nr:signal peptidase I [Clostridiales bacterium]MCD8225296.1 signal peptidase I [Clostridiales bacterium]
MDFYQNDEPSLVRRAVSWIVDITVALSFAWLCMYAFGGQVSISGQSMTPLLESGDVVLVNRLIYDFGAPKRLDVVVFEREDGKENVKRVIGLPGDVVQISGGQLYINGEPFDDENGLGEVALAGLAEHPVELLEDEYFLLGDNRDSSEDSRFANIGNVKREQILGKVWMRILPLLDIGLIRSAG